MNLEELERVTYNMEQGSPEWFEARKYVLTASNATAIGNAGAGLKTYVKKLLSKEISDEETYTSKDIERGNELEPIARLKYQFEYGVEVEEVGFISAGGVFGCSPDGLIGEDGGLEIKARNNEKHLELLLGNGIDSSTHWQIQMSLYVTGREWWDFVSYNPNFKNSLYRERVFRDEAKIEKLKKGIVAGKELLDEYMGKLKDIKEIEL